MNLINIKDFLYYRRKVIGIFLFIIIAGISYFILSNKDEVNADTIIEEKIDDKEEIIEEKTINKVVVDIKGYVKKPGTYTLEEGKRVKDVIKEAGGIIKNGDTSLINLSKIISDEMVIIIYSKEEVNNFIENKKTIEVEKCNNCSIIKNDALIDDINNEVPIDEASNTSISINKGSLEDLMMIPGIGKTKAMAIIEYRDKNGLLTNIEDIMNVSGIGTSTFENIKKYLKL